MSDEDRQDANLEPRGEDLAILSRILASCSNHLDIDGIEDVFEHFFELDEEVSKCLFAPVFMLGGMYCDMPKLPELPTRELAGELFREFVTIPARLSANDALRESAAMREKASNVAHKAFESCFELLNAYTNKTDDAQLLRSAEVGLCKTIDALKGILKDSNQTNFADAINEANLFLKSAMSLLESAYHDDPVPPHNPPVNDEAVTFPTPDETELNAYLPSSCEKMHSSAIEWLVPDNECNCMFINSRPSDPPLFVNECLNRLWGKSQRIANDTTLSLTQMAQIPRLAMYPFYASFFSLAHGMYGAAKQYSQRLLRPHKGSIVFKNPCDGGPFIFKRMKEVLRFAPREYFEQGRQHRVYMQLIVTIFERGMDMILESLPDKLAALQITAEFSKAKDLFRRFACMLQSPGYGTSRTYAAECDSLVEAFKTSLHAISAVLVVVENEITQNARNSEETRLDDSMPPDSLEKQEYRDAMKAYCKTVADTLISAKKARTTEDAVHYIRSCKRGDRFFAYCEKVRKAADLFGWKDTTLHTYCKGGGKQKRDIERQAKIGRKKKLIADSLDGVGLDPV